MIIKSIPYRGLRERVQKLSDECANIGFTNPGMVNSFMWGKDATFWGLVNNGFFEDAFDLNRAMFAVTEAELDDAYGMNSYWGADVSWLQDLIGGV